MLSLKRPEDSNHLSLCSNSLQNYLIGAHPHGILSTGSVANFCSNGTGVFDLFPGMNIRLCTLKINFLVPVRREWLLANGCVDCSKESLQYLLDTDKTTNNMVVLVIGKFIDYHNIFISAALFSGTFKILLVSTVNEQEKC